MTGFQADLADLFPLGNTPTPPPLAHCRLHFCSMEITEDVRKFAAEQKTSEEQALQIGLEQKAKECKEYGAEVYTNV